MKRVKHHWQGVNKLCTRNKIIEWGSSRSYSAITTIKGQHVCSTGTAKEWSVTEWTTSQFPGWSSCNNAQASYINSRAKQNPVWSSWQINISVNWAVGEISWLDTIVF
jgi:hypothetical protein